METIKIPGKGKHGKGGRKPKNQVGYSFKYVPTPEAMAFLKTFREKSDIIDQALLFFKENNLNNIL